MTEIVKSKRGLQRYATNPFVSGAATNCKVGQRRISNKKGDKFMVVSEAGEVVAPAGFHEVVEVDKTQFVKLYINGVKAFQGLKAPGTKVFEIIYRAVQKVPGTDQIWLHFMAVQQEITPISESTFYRGLRELLDKGFLAESTAPGMFFLNIDYMFNGNRLAFIKEYRIKSDDEQMERSIAKQAKDEPHRDPNTIDLLTGVSDAEAQQ